jgi:hypothetical protein
MSQPCGPRGSSLVVFDLVVIIPLIVVAEGFALANVSLLLVQAQYTPHQMVEAKEVDAINVSVEVHVRRIEVRHAKSPCVVSASSSGTGMLGVAIQRTGSHRRTPFLLSARGR